MNTQQQHTSRRYPLLGPYPQIYSAPPHQPPQRYATRFGLKRPHYEYDNDYVEEEAFLHSTTPNTTVHTANFQVRHRSTDKTRGLRHFAHKVCEKVKEKGQTNYNEVADELVAEYFDQLVEFPQDPEKYQYDVRNIRRRVYDALNVLMAMNIIEKEKKEIRWMGLPTSSLAECRRLEEEKSQRQERIRQKTEQLQELIVQLVAYKSLVKRNREREREQGRPPNSAILYLPYIIISMDKKTLVECAIAPDKSEYWFNFDRPFEIHDDIEVLKRLGLAYGIDRGEVKPEKIAHIKACLPPALRDYVDQILEGTFTNRKIKNAAQTAPSLVKLDPYSGNIRTTPGDSIVVKATRANLSGVAPSGDGGPMGSFLSPIDNPIMRTYSPQTQHPPVARYTVIPRPVSARYSSQNVFSSRYGALSQPISQHYEHQQHYQPSRPGQHRLGGVLHYEVPVHPMRDPMLQHRQMQEAYDQQQMLEYQMEAGYGAEEYIDAGGEEIVEEVVADEHQ